MQALFQVAECDCTPRKSDTRAKPEKSVCMVGYRLKRADLKQESYQYVRVFSDHFVNGMPSALYDVNNPDWSPSLKLGYEFQVTGKDRYERMTARTARKRHSGNIDICSSPELESDH